MFGCLKALACTGFSQGGVSKPSGGEKGGGRLIKAQYYWRGGGGFSQFSFSL